MDFEAIWQQNFAARYGELEAYVKAYAEHVLKHHIASNQGPDTSDLPPAWVDPPVGTDANGTPVA